MNLLDLIETADQAKNEAIDRVEANASPQWLTAAYNVIVEIAMSGRSFTSDQVWDVLERTKVDAPHEPRAMGVLFRRAVQEGLITATGQYVPSTRIVCHGNPKRCWRRA